LLVVVAAPFSLPYGSVEDLSGRVGEIDNDEQLEEMNLFARVVYTIGDINCHQLEGRSYHLNGNQMPFCTRDLGIFIGLVMGLGLALLLRLRISFLVLILLLAPMGLDGGLQLLTPYESSNVIRMITGIIGGAGLGLILSRLARQALDIGRLSERMDPLGKK
jgi:uncharacterized membrane protein